MQGVGVGQQLCNGTSNYFLASHCGSSGLELRSIHVGFVVDKRALKEVFL